MDGKPITDSPNINTDGGAVVAGDVNTKHFAGRDLTVINEGDEQYNVAGISNPYLGLKPFGYNDRENYAGRQAIIEDIVKLLTQPGEQLSQLFVLGASGSGKSSLVFAGVLPKLENYYKKRNQQTQWVDMRPAKYPMSVLKDALDQLGISSLDSFDVPQNQRKFLVIDQFEELFTQSEELEKTDFCNWLEMLPPFTQSRLHVLITIRVDYLPELFDINSALFKFAVNGIDLHSMNVDQLQEAIQRPIQRLYPNGEKYFEPALVEKLADETSKSETYLPLLQVTLADIWRRGSLKLSEYNDLTEAISRRADEVLQYDKDNSPRSDAEQKRIIEIFLELIITVLSTRHSTNFAIRRRRPLDELIDNIPHRGQLIDELARGRLLSIIQEREIEFVHIIHDSLIPNWGTLQNAIQEYQELLKQRMYFENAFYEWESRERDSELLLSRIRLAEAEGLDAHEGVRLNEDEQYFIRRSILERDKLQRRQLFAIVGVAIILAIASIVSLLARNQTVRQLEISRSAQVAAVARTELDNGNARRSLQLSTIALDSISDIDQTRQVLRKGLENWRYLMTLSGHTKQVYGIHFSRNKQMIATASRDNTARVWDVDTGRQIFNTSIHEDNLTSAVFSLDNQFLLTSSLNNNIKVWEIESSKLKYTLSVEMSDGQKIHGIGIHPNGLWFAARGGNTIWLWDIASGKEVHHSPYRTPPGVSIRSLAFTQQGDAILAGAADNAAHIWHIELGVHASLIFDDNGHQTAVTDVIQTPDKAFIVSMSEDRILLWEYLDNRFIPRILDQSNTGERFQQVEFSPDSNYLAAGGASGTTRVWDLRNIEDKPIRLDTHTDPITDIAFSSNSLLLATGSLDGDLKIWNTRSKHVTNLLKTQQNNVRVVSFDRSSEILATANATGDVYLWRVWLGGNIGYIPQIAYPVSAFEMADERVMSVGSDGVLQISDIQNQSSHIIQVGSERLTEIALYEDIAAVGDVEGNIYIFNTETEDLHSPWKAHRNAVNNLLFIPENGLLLSTGGEPTVKVWDWQNDDHNSELVGHNNDVTDLVIGPNGNLFSASLDKTIRQWDLQTQESEPIIETEAQPLALAIDHRGDYLAYSGSDEKIYIVELATSTTSSLSAGTRIRTMVFEDNEMLLTGGEDGTIQRWDIDSRTRVSWNGHDGRWVRDFHRVGDNSSFYSLGDDGLIKVWPLETQDLLTLACERSDLRLSPDEWNELFTFSTDLDGCEQISATPIETIKIPIEEELGLPIGKNLPVIHYFESLSGSTIPVGTLARLQWRVENANTVHIQVDDEEPQGEIGNAVKEFTVQEDTRFQLIAENTQGKRTWTIEVEID